MFVGRDKELSALERRWSSQQFECVVVYGRRRVGKTTLINRFLEDRPTIFFSAIESSASKNLESLSRSIALYEKGSEAFETAPVYRSFESALEAVFALAAKQRIASSSTSTHIWLKQTGPSIRSCSMPSTAIRMTVSS